MSKQNIRPVESTVVAGDGQIERDGAIRSRTGRQLGAEPWAAAALPALRALAGEPGGAGALAAGAGPRRDPAPRR